MQQSSLEHNVMDSGGGFPKKGFAILYAVLVSALLLSIGVSIYNISSKQYILSSSAIDSQISIYAADAGIECALYWDEQGAFGSPDKPHVDHTIRCNSRSTTLTENRSSSRVVTTFTTDFNPPGETPGPNGQTLDLQCGNVTVTKDYVAAPPPTGSPLPPAGPGTIKVTIDSRGYNYCNTNPRKVERALRVTYSVDADS